MKTVKLTKREIEMVVDAINRMICDDVWDEYTQAENDALHSALDKIRGE